MKNIILSVIIALTIPIIILVFLENSGNAGVHNEQSQENIIEYNESLISTKAKQFLDSHWDASSMAQGISLLNDSKESVQSRKLVLDKLRSKGHELSSKESEKLIYESILIVKDPKAPPVLSVSAVKTIASLYVLGKERGDTTESEVKRDFSFLIEIAGDKNEDIALRKTVIRSIGDLHIEGAVNLLRELLDDPIENSRPEIARDAMLALWRLEEKDAIVPISEVLAHTKDSSIFGTAVYSLGQIKTVESMVNIIKYADRFPDSGSPDAVLVDMEDIILDVLKNSQDENLNSAIKATHYLWQEGQRERYIPLLRGLLKTASIEVRRNALDRLLEVTSTFDFETEKTELIVILPIIENQPELNEYTSQIKSRLSAEIVIPTTDKISPVPVVLPFEE